MAARMKKQFITDDRGNRVAVVLDIKTYDEMQDAIDDYHCKRAYEKAKPSTDAEIAAGKYVTIEEYVTKRRTRQNVKRRVT